MKNEAILKIQKIGFQWEMENPFLFCAHHQDNYPAGNKNQGIDRDKLSGRNIGSDFVIKDGYRMYHGQEVPGFPVHPHRGFETVTVVTEGFVDHFDSLGSKGRYGQGDVQWLTTGKGCQHAEMFPLIDENKTNPLELFQIWLNLPKKNKFADPAYKMFWGEDIPVVEEISPDGKKSTVKIIAGQLRDKTAITPAPFSWAADPSNEVGIFLIRMDANAVVTIPAVSEDANRNLYFYSGQSIKIGDTDISGSNRIKLAADQNISIVNGDRESYLLLLEGKPINEPVVQYGPFVMNTEQEIQEAFADYRSTEFGGWPWDQEIPVNDRKTGRYARYTDGTEEFR